MKKLLLGIMLSFFTIAYATIERIELKKGETVPLEIESQPGSTGYSWRLVTKLKKKDPIAVVNSGYSPSKTDLIGSPGTQFWMLEGKHRGKKRIVLEYKRAWDKEPVQVKEFEVIVK